MYDNIYLPKKGQECEAKMFELIESPWSVICKSGSFQLTWTVVPDSIAEVPPVEFENMGVRDMDWEKFDTLSEYAKASAKKKEASIEKSHPFLDLFLLLWPGDWRKQLHQLNCAIEKDFKSKSKHKHSIQYIKSVAANAFFIFIGIIIISGAFGKGGKLLFKKESDRIKDEVFRRTPSIDLTPFMAMRCFEDIKMHFLQAFSDVTKADPKSKEYDPWYMLSVLISDFHHNRQKKVAASLIKILDESMSAWCPQKDRWIAKHFFYFANTRTFGTEFKSMACSSTGVVLFLEIQRGKAVMPKWNEKYHELEATTSCCIQATKPMANCGQKEGEHCQNLIAGDSWFSSLKMAEAIHRMGHDWIGIVKTSDSLFPKKRY
jgi:hypothetical protein